ncbi:MAG: hypothetical protein WDO18_22820 [Acidobacteriota bacterium]
MTRLTGIALAAIAGAALATLPIAGQGQAKGKGKDAAKANPAVVHAPVPRAADGKPDLTGTWQSGGREYQRRSGRSAAASIAPHRQSSDPARAAGLQAEWEAKRKKLDVALDDPTLFCLLPGVPRISTMPMPLEIVQTPKEIVILHEAFRAWRRIPIDANLKHPDDVTPTWMGDSVGRWEGDTFVVDTIGFNDKSWIAGAASIHSEAMHVVERYTLNTDGSLSFESMVEDKGRPREALLHTGAIFRRPIDVRVEEYECIENNPDPGHMFKAAGRTK